MSILLNSNPSVVQLLYRLWQHVTLRRRFQFTLLFITMILTSFAEVLSLGAVLPFLSALTMPEKIYEHPQAQFFIDILGITSPGQLVLPLTIVFSVAALCAGGMRLFMTWISTRLSFATVADLSMSVYRNTLYQPYSVHIARNSSEILAGIGTKISSVISTFIYVFTLISSAIIFVSIMILMVSVTPVIAFSVFGGFGSIYALVIGLTRVQLKLNGQLIAREEGVLFKLLQEAIGGIRDILLDSNQEVYCKIFRNTILPLRRAQGYNSFLGVSPRYVVEALGMMLIAALAYFLALQDGGLIAAIPLLGLLALSAQRMLPLLHQIYSSWATIQGTRASLEDALVLLDQPLPEYAGKPRQEPMSFGHKIRLKKLSFRYNDDSPWVLRNLDFTIPKGSRVGFIGTTGSGKSTLLDILMGLLEPKEGIIEVDGQVIDRQNFLRWQAHIAHVPQSIFLADTSINENIAFGVAKENIDHDRVRKAAAQAQIAEFIEAMPEKYNTFVGERGVRLSGGQRQRIGIARALYKRADVIIFDEATSALDNETEKAVMNAIDDLSKDLTILIIAHRLSTLENCDYIVELSEGEVKRIAQYEELSERQ